MRHPRHPYVSTTSDPTAERGRTRRRRGDFPDAPYEEGFDPRRGGPRVAFPHEHHEHEGHRGPRGFGGPGFGGPGFGPGGRGRGPGRRAGRGDIRAAILLLLAE